MDFPRALTWGGGGLLALVGVALVGFLLPGPARLVLVALGIGGVRLLARLEDGPERDVIMPMAIAVVAWLGLTWGLAGLAAPIVAVGLVALGLLTAALWSRYGWLVQQIEEAEGPPAEPPPAPEPTPDERLDSLLEEAPIKGLEFAAICTAMEPWMKRSTVAARLNQRGLKVGHGRWRAKPRGVE